MSSLPQTPSMSPGREPSALAGGLPGAPAEPGPAVRRTSRRMRTIAAAGVALMTAAGVIGLVPVAASASTQATSRVLGNCVARPSACGYPDATNTGVPAGMALKTVPRQISHGPGWHFDSRGWVEVDGNGTVLSGLNIPYDVDVTGSNVTIKDSRIVNTGQSSFGVSVRHTSNVTIENDTISGTDPGSGRVMAAVKDIYSDSTGLSILRNNIYYTSTGVQLESGLVQDNYIHDLGLIPGDHLNGVASHGGVHAGPLTIRHNTILNNRNQTDAVGLFEDFGPQVNRVIDNNLLAGGSYPIYGGQNSDGPATSNITVTNNRISTLYFPGGGSYGAATHYNPHGAGNVWSGNIWDSNGQPVPAPG